jgi:hypothetical protein
MNPIGVYEESLPCGGKLKVSRIGWEILYYFPGPDLRHNGKFFTIAGASISRHIQAYEENWQEFAQLKATIPKGGTFSKPGTHGMTIRIGDFAEGVCVEHYRLPINSEQALKKMLDGYRYAAERAVQIQVFLKNL